MQVFIRLANILDVPLICSLADKIWREHYPSIITTEQIDYMLEQWYNPTLIEQQIANQEQQFWMVSETDGGTPFGYLALCPKEAPGAYYLNKFYIDHRGKGAGTAAFKAVLAHYPDLVTMRLNVNRRNFKSVNFYFKMGFVIEEVYDLPVGDRYIMDDFIMLYHR